MVNNISGNFNSVGNIQNNYSGNISGADRQKSEIEETPRDRVSLQRLVNYDSADLTSSGKLGVIIQSRDPEQLAVLKEKVLENPENRIKADLPLISAFAAEIDPQSQSIASGIYQSQGQVSILLDEKVQMIEPIDPHDTDVTIMMDVAGKTMNIDKMWEAGFTGKGKTICVIDTGVAQHPDFKGRIKAFKDFVNGKTEAYDDQGHGTHCAGIAAGDGSASEGKFKGVAPDADIVGVKVLNKWGSGNFSDIVSGVQWAIENKDALGIDVISMSLGGSTNSSYKNSPIALAVEKAAELGILPVVAAGNDGRNGDQTIATPANAPHAITIGALNDKGTVDRNDDDVADFSSRGYTRVDGLAKPDVLTPGVNITAPKNTGGYTTMSGTSMATPMAAGMFALLKQASPTTSVGEMKGVVMGTADDLKGLPHKDQGAGVFDVVEAYKKLTGKELTPA